MARGKKGRPACDSYAGRQLCVRDESFCVAYGDRVSMGGSVQAAAGYTRTLLHFSGTIQGWAAVTLDGSRSTVRYSIRR